MGAVHPQHNPVIACGWIKRVEEQEVKSNTGRRRVNINGAINLERLEPVVRFDDTIDAASTIALFEQLEALNLVATWIYVIWDNARYYPDVSQNARHGGGLGDKGDNPPVRAAVRTGERQRLEQAREQLAMPMQARRRNQGGKRVDELQRCERELRGAIAPGRGGIGPARLRGARTDRRGYSGDTGHGDGARSRNGARS